MGSKILDNEKMDECARTAVEAWVDDDANRAGIMQAGLDEIKRRPAFQAILRDYAGYGDPIQEKLLRHLVFMVENRRKYYKAAGARGS
jgi:hypothetical protein